MMYTIIKYLFKYLLLFLGSPVVIMGKENIPSSGPLILVANHESLLDGFLLLVLCKQQITSLSAAYLFKLPIVGLFLRYMGAIPVQNEAGELTAMRNAIRILQEGKTIIIFPEGRISNRDELCPFQPGWAYFALKTGAQIVPIAIKGSRTVLPKGSIIPRRGKIYMKISEPWTLEKVKHPKRELLYDLNIKLFNQIDDMLKNLSK